MTMVAIGSEYAFDYSDYGVITCSANCNYIMLYILIHLSTVIFAFSVILFEREQNAMHGNANWNIKSVRCQRKNA